MGGLGRWRFGVTAWLGSAFPVLPSSTAVNDCEVPRMSGPAVEGERTRLAPAKLLVTDVMKELATGPYVLPFASCHATDAVSVRLPEGCPSGTAKPPHRVPDAPHARRGGPRDRAPGGD